MLWLWLSLIVAFILVEAVTYQLVCIWFAFGSIGGLIAAFFTDSVTVQVTVFVIVSAIMLLCLRPFARKGLSPKGLKTNVEELVGKEVFVTESIRNLQSKGRGKVNGMEWALRSSDGKDIDEGKTVVIEKVEGVKLIVKEIDE